MQTTLVRFLIMCGLAIATMLTPVFIGQHPMWCSALMLLFGGVLAINLDRNFIPAADDADADSANQLALERLRLWWVYLFMFIGGPFAELCCISHGLWTYAPNVVVNGTLGIPPWLGFAWGGISVFIIRLYKAMSALLADPTTSMQT
jgi:hypothetical protein